MRPPLQEPAGRFIMIKDVFDRWWEWVEKPPDSTLTIPAHFHDAVMQLPPEQRRDRRTVNEGVRLADPDAQRRTGQADFPHPALGQNFTPSPTARRAQACSGARAQSTAATAQDHEQAEAHGQRGADTNLQDPVDHPAGLGVRRSGLALWAWRNECVRRILVTATGCSVPPRDIRWISDGYNGLNPP